MKPRRPDSTRQTSLPVISLDMGMADISHAYRVIARSLQHHADGDIAAADEPCPLTARKDVTLAMALDAYGKQSPNVMGSI